MNNLADTKPLDPVLIENINHISGAYAALFWEVIYGTTESLTAMRNTLLLLQLLYYDLKYREAILLIHTYHELLGLEFPQEMLLVEKTPELHQDFVYEYLLDAEDIILDFEFAAMG